MTKIYNDFFEDYVSRRSDFNRLDYNRDIEAPALIKLIGAVKNKTILDIGCGFGYHAEILSDQNFKELIGFDASEKLIEIANKKDIPNTNFYVADMSKPLNHQDNYFDIVYSSLAIHYIKDIENLFKEIFRVLKNEGVFIFSTGHPIFNLRSKEDQSPDENKMIISNNYFNESPQSTKIGEIGKIEVYNFTLEKIFKSAHEAGFTLVDYVDAKPILEAKSYDLSHYQKTMNFPTFSLFKFKAQK